MSCRPKSTLERAAHSPIKLSTASPGALPIPGAPHAPPIQRTRQTITLDEDEPTEEWDEVAPIDPKDPLPADDVAEPGIPTKDPSPDTTPS